ncbi:Homeodomain-related protein [Cordyceps fumosorosea ARSEF 2679]|uniref:Homeodomain-related protein n=1 Tax=Cordyceps fumosorosea (strain ARSEF 2679) TaxID=1081104 RepID=A0A168B3B1_CORFA|nr:Homeodomain-related protein [Cordyceps fumosorosea ARSEF 2679]OAA69563.1 Homeodomain-related protein [Cordyceps fumosorosea ARSEF 2679]
MTPFTSNNWASWPYTVSDPFAAAAAAYSQVSNTNYPTYMADSMDPYQVHHQRLLNQQMPRTTESKPRLSKEEVEILEAEFQKNHKPNSTTKKALAESMRVDNARINVSSLLVSYTLPIVSTTISANTPKNWFQNRRAREKKEKNIREYEAKQKQEKDKAVADGVSIVGHRKRDLVASSAPFPGSQPASHIRDSSSSPVATPNSTIIDLIKSDGAPSTETTPELVSEASTFDTRKESTRNNTEDKSPEEINDHLSISDASTDALSVSDNELYMPMANRSPSQLLGPEFQSLHAGGARVNPLFSSPMFLGTLETDESRFGGLVDRDISISPTCQLTAGMHLKSPPCIDIATRRNRRPTPLAINAARTGTSGCGLPKSAIDFGKMAETTSFMRRTSSASSSGRVSKPACTPRNMLSMHRSPSSTTGASSMAPPTPDTPIVNNAQGLNDLTLAGPFSLDTKLAGFIAHDPTLSTPPTTPGMVDNMFSMNSVYGMGVSEDYLVNTGLSGLPASYDLAAVSVPGYVNDVSTPVLQVHGAYSQQSGHPFHLGLYSNADWSEA